MAARVIGATEDALGMHLGPEGDHVRGLGDPLQRLGPAGQGLAGVGVDESLDGRLPHRQPTAGIDEMVMGWPPDLVIGSRGDLPDHLMRNRPP
jgi:hypothetical protein